MGIKNLHTTINYKELIERQANAKVQRINPVKTNKKNQANVNNTCKVFRKNMQHK